MKTFVFVRMSRALCMNVLPTVLFYLSKEKSGLLHVDLLHKA